MQEGLRLHLEWIKYAIPSYVYEGVLLILCIVVILLLIWKGLNSWRAILKLVLIEYAFLLYCSTVFYRITKIESEYNLKPFWSYCAIQSGREDLVAENILNIIVFLPVGLLLGCSTSSIRWWMIIFVGCGISISIEFLQLVLKKGFTEVDDVIHNTIGCLLGYGAYCLVDRFIQKVRSIWFLG